MPVIEELPLSLQRPTGPGWTYVVEARNRGRQPAGDRSKSSSSTPHIFPIQTGSFAMMPSGSFTPTPTITGTPTGHTPGGGGAGVSATGVPPAGVGIPGAGTQGGRVRATRRQIAGTSTIVLEEQQASRNLLAVTRRLGELERENARDVQIPIPVVKSNRKKNKYNSATTPAVRKIMQSQKTFTNHLNDEEAMISLQQNQSLYATGNSSSNPTTAPAQGSSTVRGGRKKDGSKRSADKSGSVSRANSDSAGGVESPVKKKRKFPLSVEVPAVPTDALLDQMTASPAPLSYLGSRARPADVSVLLASRAGLGLSGPVPPRLFCEYCGYWGKIKCIQCGSRTCGLGCKRLHDELCLRRYG